jgi:Phytochelatin synthase
VRRSLLFASLLLVGLVGAAGTPFLTRNITQQAIEASVIRSPELIARAWQLPVAATFARTLAWQTNGSLCGPASVANVYRSLHEPAQTEGDVLAGTGRCWTGFCVFGLTLDELADVARSHTQRKVTVLRDLSPAEFKEHMRRANELGHRYIINFSRERLFGAGVGHFSPIGGYLEDEDLVFILDVNRRYQPWLVSRDRLFHAMDTFDGPRRRGLLLIE